MMNELDRPATQAEAYREMVVNMGQDRPEQCWILTPYDTWERNPAYTGPLEPHPEDDRGEWEVPVNKPIIPSYSEMDFCPLCQQIHAGQCRDLGDDPRFFPSEECGDDGVPF